MVGRLYKIINNKNEKIYIGKTYKTLEQRFKEHLLESKKHKSKGRKIYKAINEIGGNNFTIELIGEYEEGILEGKEQEYIKLYNTYRNGYNSTLGGDGKRYLEC